MSLPHYRAAGHVLAQRLGVKLVEAELPFGLEATRRFMELLYREFDTGTRRRRISSRRSWTRRCCGCNGAYRTLFSDGDSPLLEIDTICAGLPDPIDGTRRDDGRSA